MTNVFKQQVIDLETMLPTFKITSAIIHYDVTSPHLHIIGVPIKIGGKNGMKKQVGKVMYLQKNHFVNFKIK